MKAAILAVAVSLSIPALAQIPSPPGAPIENVCGNVAGQSQTQRENCVRQEEQSREDVDPANADPAIRRFCRDTVGEGVALQNACIQQENLSKARIETMAVDGAVRTRCEKTAGDSFVKMEACIQKEAATP